MTKESLETSISGLEVWLIVFACIVAIGVGGEFIFGWISWSKHRALRTVLRQEEQQLRLQIEGLRSNNLELKSQLEKVRRAAQGERVWLITKEAINILEREPPGKVDILFEASDKEAHNLATSVQYLLTQAKWSVAEPRPVGETTHPLDSGMPAVGVALNINNNTAKTMPKKGSPLLTLASFLRASNIAFGIGTLPDDRVPDDIVRISIGHR